ncbi:hypothetical protein LSUE1_G007844 [Lachnellula suecica]|uniref:PDZ domain-containing protein n=1 Tax=Lachnellula suecica TaxID=602035 RepID=A0A8T9C144_9HELO|nr:hypothetical protein LSUE1_G007844 [Lachnellula suecica]
MYSRAVLLSILSAVAEARFGQEQTPISAISALTAGSPGVAQTLGGGSVSLLLAAANPCDKYQQLKQGDKILTELGTGADVLAAARGLVAAEQNFNPFVVSVPAICSDPTLPVNPLLRGVVPLVDPAVGGAAGENANSATSLTTPFAADGLSVAEVMSANGFSNFTTKAADGTAGTAPAAGALTGASTSSNSTVAVAAGNSTAVISATPVIASASVANCGGTTFVTVTKAAATASAVASSSVASASASASAVAGSSSSTAGVDPGFQASSIAGLDFGTCTPTIKFEAGLNGRKETEFTFQAIDPVVNKGQQEALNPNIITNRICDQLGNVCGASDAAKAACLAAKAQISALGTKDATTADAWNTALGFAGTNTNPDNAPQTGLVGHT